MLSQTTRLSARRAALSSRPRGHLATIALDIEEASPVAPVWSGSLSYASPEHDFCGAQLPEALAAPPAQPSEWSTTLSFASAESDFCGTPTPPEATPGDDFYKVEWLPKDQESEYSFASPESDFATVPLPERERTASVAFEGPVVSESLSFASPESDFVGTPTPPEATPGPDFYKVEWLPKDVESNFSFASPEADFATLSMPTSASAAVTEEPLYSETLSFASPEADFAASSLPASTVQTDETQPTFSEAFSFSSPESDFTGESAVKLRAEQLAALPQTLAQALMESQRALVVTTENGTVVHVNRAWEDMVGYTKAEALRHGNLEHLIHGLDTNADLLHNAVERLQDKPLHQKEDTYIVNYKADGSCMVNHVTLGRLKVDLESERADYFVRVLEEVSPDEVPLKMAA